jgi:hypothetical protein
MGLSSPSPRVSFTLRPGSCRGLAFDNNTPLPEIGVALTAARRDVAADYGPPPSDDPTFHTERERDTSSRRDTWGKLPVFTQLVGFDAHYGRLEGAAQSLVRPDDRPRRPGFPCPLRSLRRQKYWLAKPRYASWPVADAAAPTLLNPGPFSPPVKMLANGDN